MAGSHSQKRNSLARASGKGEQGVTLLEIMVAMAVSMVVIVTVSQTMVRAGRSAVSVRLDTSTGSLLSQMMTILRSSNLCSKAFVDNAGNPINVNPASYPINVQRFDFNPAATFPGTYIARQNKRSSGVLVSSMVLDNPSLVAGARYRWSFKLTTQKVDEQGNGFGDTPTQVHNFRISITTNDGSPDYHITSCGIELADPMSVPPPAIVMTRGLWPVNTSNANKDIKCNEVGSDYVAATLADLYQTRAAYGNQGAIPSGAQFVTVYGDTTNTYVLTSLGAGNGTEIHPTVGGSGQIACVHRTAPLRFTRTSHASNEGEPAHQLNCNKAFGPHYMVANFSDLLQYGFATVASNGLNSVGYLDLSLNGSASTCRTAYLPNLGPALDCTQAAANNPLGCVIRSR